MVKRRPRKLTKPRATKKAKRSVVLPSAQDYLRELQSASASCDVGMFSEEVLSTPVTEFVPTGSLAIDKLTGGGWPVGRISECAAWEGVGKSTLLDQSIAQCQRSGGIACLIDTEEARDVNYMKALGVDVDSLIGFRAKTLEGVFDCLGRMLDLQEKTQRDLTKRYKSNPPQPPPLLVVIDSVGGTPTRAELEGSAEDQHVGVAARAIKKNLRRLTSRVATLRTAVVFANHFYHRIGQVGLVTYGGSGILYFTSLRLWLTRTGNITVGPHTVGHTLNARIKKTRITAPREPIELGLIYGNGIDNTYTLYEWGRKSGAEEGHVWVAQSGPWSYLQPPGEDRIPMQRRFYGLSQVFDVRPDLYRKMAKGFRREG